MIELVKKIAAVVGIVISLMIVGAMSAWAEPSTPLDLSGPASRAATIARDNAAHAATEQARQFWLAQAKISERTARDAARVGS